MDHCTPAKLKCPPEPSPTTTVSGDDPDILDTVPASLVFLTIPSIYRRQWTASACLSGGEKASLGPRWLSFVHLRVREWSIAVNRGALLSLTWVCLLPLSAAVSDMVLLAAGLGTLCALTSLFASMAYVRRRNLLEQIVHDEGAVRLPLNIWIFLSLPSLYFGWSLLLLAAVLLWCLCAPRHQPLSWALAGPEVPLYVTGIGIPLLLIPYRLVVRNFQLLSQTTEPAVAAGTSALQPTSSN